MNRQLAVTLLLFMGSPLASAAPSAADAQVAFLKAYYKGYIAHLGKRNAAYVAATPFYSSKAKALLEANARTCKALARGDDICGYEAGGDTILDSQEISPTLTFAKSGFQARPLGTNLVEVSFNVYPEERTARRSTIRYTLVRENGEWRVDDLIPGNEGRFDPANSMQRRIAEENAMIEKQALDLGEVRNWLGIYAESNMPERFARFVRFPLQVCDRNRRCVPYFAQAPLGGVLTDLRTHYFAKGGASGVSAPADITEGSIANSGPLMFTFRDKAWWLTRIDWSRATPP